MGRDRKPGGDANFTATVTTRSFMTMAQPNAEADDDDDDDVGGMKGKMWSSIMRLTAMPVLDLQNTGICEHFVDVNCGKTSHSDVQVKVL